MLSLCIPAAAAADDLGYQVETSVASTYVSRGIVQYRSRGTASSQSTVSAHHDDVFGGSIAASFWSAFALGQFDTQPGTAVQLDTSIAYIRTLDDVKLTTGFLWSLFPQHMDGAPIDGTYEVFVGAQLEGHAVSPFVAANIEIVRQQGVYTAFGVTRDVVLDRFTMTPTASIGFAAYRKYLGTDMTAGLHANDVTTALNVRYDLPSHAYVSGRVSFAAQLTPARYAPAVGGWGLDERSSLVGVFAVGVAR